MGFQTYSLGRKKHEAIHGQLRPHIYGIKNTFLVPSLYVRGKVAVDKRENFRRLIDRIVIYIGPEPGMSGAVLRISWESPALPKLKLGENILIWLEFPGLYGPGNTAIIYHETKVRHTLPAAAFHSA
jgi:hypothetical protein